MKIGRKGDPRMHLAVGARIANPKLNLFEALKIGGFAYPNDDDPNFMDSEFVTLGQRKNQLCRRIRIAMRKCDGKNACSDSTCYKTNKIGVCKSLPCPLGHVGLFPRPLGNLVALSQLKHRQKDIKIKQAGATNDKSCTTDFIPAIMHSDLAGIQHDLAGQSTDECIGPRGTQISGQFSDDHLAVESLKQTAASIGMTLDQLALTLANWNDPVLFQLESRQSRQNCAVALHQSENQLLLEKAMVFAGFSPEIAQNDESCINLQVAFSAWNHEGNRIRKNISKLRQMGRMPILHHPAGCTTPHMDFVVEDRVECYFGTDGPNQDHALDNGRDKTGIAMDYSHDANPKVYDMNDINLDDIEWYYQKILTKKKCCTFFHRLFPFKIKQFTWMKEQATLLTIPLTTTLLTPIRQYKEFLSCFIVEIDKNNYSESVFSFTLVRSSRYPFCCKLQMMKGY